MSTNSLGWSEDLDKYWSEELLDSPDSRVHIQSVNERNVYSFPEVSNYPYEGQLEISGTFEYDIPTGGDSHFTNSGEYTYREASGLFLLETITDRPTPKEVISEINKFVSDHAKIEEALSLNRDDLWSFFANADSFEKFIVRDSNGTYDLVILIELLNRDDPVSVLEEDDFREDVNRDVLLSVINEIPIPEEIDDVRDLDIDWYNKIIDTIEANFWYDNYPASVEYRRGLLEIDSDNDATSEYVLQLFERDVVHPALDSEW
ncbi:hypothetical protein [Haloarchaeobius sp. DYHT-AS-18]|uniref:hypothetical protein n=1 Tax=Haloarchaeobius sp. DYHT-AS-18 TaxID=3446117 RepID=UPI003EBF1A2B